MAVQSTVLRALWKTPTHLLSAVAVTQELGRGWFPAGAGGSWKDSREIAVLGKVRAQSCCMAGAQKYEAVDCLQARNGV